MITSVMSEKCYIIYGKSTDIKPTKRNGVWLKGDKVFLKVGGVWSEQTPSIDTVISGVFEGKKLLIDGKLN